LLSSELIDAAVHMQAGTTRKPGSLALCEREGQEIVGEKPRRLGTRTGRPKKLRNVVPDYPERPKGTTVRVGGAWVGEVLIDANGKVAHVWTTRELKFTPPFPSFNQAIVDAIRQWEFEPLRVDKRPVPVCMAVSININWS